MDKYETKTFSKLKVGDQVTVKTWYELLTTKDVIATNPKSLNLKVNDKKNPSSNEVFLLKMQAYCGATLTVKQINYALCKVNLEGAKNFYFTRKMLKEEVIKHD